MMVHRGPARAERGMMAIDAAGAEKKLRQAEFFVDHLEYLSKQPSHRGLGDPEHLEFFFSASLTAARRRT
jgi:hypothetical protein